MTHSRLIFCITAVCLFCAFAATSLAAPYEGKTFKGRIAYSADGNHNDPDDWIASPVALAIFAAECVYGRPRVRMETSYLVAQDGKSCVLQVAGESGEAAARIFSGLAAVRCGEAGFQIHRETTAT